jgi:hypothetical protein
VRLVAAEAEQRDAEAAISPEARATLLELAWTLLRCGNLKRAAQLAEASHSLSPNDPVAQLLRLLMRAQTGAPIRVEEIDALTSHAPRELLAMLRSRQANDPHAPPETGR